MTELTAAYASAIVLGSGFGFQGSVSPGPLQTLMISETLSNGVVEISFMMELDSGSGTVTQVQLYDTAGQLWFSKSVSLTMEDVSEGFLYVVQLDIREVEA